MPLLCLLTTGAHGHCFNGKKKAKHFSLISVISCSKFYIDLFYSLSETFKWNFTSYLSLRHTACLRGGTLLKCKQCLPPNQTWASYCYPSLLMAVIRTWPTLSSLLVSELEWLLCSNVQYVSVAVDVYCNYCNGIKRMCISSPSQRCTNQTVLMAQRVEDREFIFSCGTQLDRRGVCVEAPPPLTPGTGQKQLCLALDSHS